MEALINAPPVPVPAKSAKIVKTNKKKSNSDALLDEADRITALAREQLDEEKGLKDVDPEKQMLARLKQSAQLAERARKAFNDMHGSDQSAVTLRATGELDDHLAVALEAVRLQKQKIDEQSEEKLEDAPQVSRPMAPSGGSQAQQSANDDMDSEVYKFEMPDQEYVLLHLTHKQLFPRADEPGFRVCGVYGDIESAREARTLMQADQSKCVVWIHQMRKPRLITDTMERMQDINHISSHLETMATNEKKRQVFRDKDFASNKENRKIGKTQIDVNRAKLDAVVHGKTTKSDGTLNSTHKSRRKVPKMPPIELYAFPEKAAKSKSSKTKESKDLAAPAAPAALVSLKDAIESATPANAEEIPTLLPAIEVGVVTLEDVVREKETPEDGDVALPTPAKTSFLSIAEQVATINKQKLEASSSSASSTSSSVSLPAAAPAASTTPASSGKAKKQFSFGALNRDKKNAKSAKPKTVSKQTGQMKVQKDGDGGVEIQLDKEESAVQEPETTADGVKRELLPFPLHHKQEHHKFMVVLIDIDREDDFVSKQVNLTRAAKDTQEIVVTCYAAFDTVERAQKYIKRAASVYYPKAKFDVVDMYQFIWPMSVKEQADMVPENYENTELQKLAQARKVEKRKVELFGVECRTNEHEMPVTTVAQPGNVISEEVRTAVQATGMDGEALNVITDVTGDGEKVTRVDQVYMTDADSTNKISLLHVASQSES